MLLNKSTPILVILLLALIIDPVECVKKDSDGDKPGKKRSRDDQGQKPVKEETDHMEEDGNTPANEKEEQNNPMEVGNPKEAQLLALNLDPDQIPAKTVTAAAAGKLNKTNKGKGKAEGGKGKMMPAVRHQKPFSKLLRPATATMKGTKSSHGGQHQQQQLTDGQLQSLKMKQLKTEMEQISQEQKTIRQGQKQVQEKFQDLANQCKELEEQTQIIVEQSMRTQERLALMFQILKARADGDMPLAARLTQFLRQMIAEGAGPSNHANSDSDTDSPDPPNQQSPREDDEEVKSGSDDNNKSDKK